MVKQRLRNLPTEERSNKRRRVGKTKVNNVVRRDLTVFDSEDEENVKVDAGSPPAEIEVKYDPVAETVEPLLEEELEEEIITEENEEDNPESLFATAFAKIMHRRIPEDAPGPILAGNRTLLASKLSEDNELKEKKIEAHKKKKEVQEKNHFIPSTFLDVQEKNLIKIATKGVVRLFNAVSKAQKSTEGTTKETTGKKSSGVALIAELSGPVSLPKAKIDSSEKVDSKWSVLQDGFDVGKLGMKHWDKEENLEEIDEEQVKFESEEEEDESENEEEDFNLEEENESDLEEELSDE